MQLSVLADEAIKEELLQKGVPAAIDIHWSNSLEELGNARADAYFDLLFVNEPSRIDALKKLLPSPIYINAVTDTLAEIEAPFVRINAWPGFLSRNIIEVVAAHINPGANLITSNDNDATANMATLDALGWKYKLIPDVPGMIAPRVIAMIVNEAYFALGEEVSSKAEIDTAMKLGTNYPFGPFEWAEKIGLENIAGLLKKLSETDDRYIPADSLLADCPEVIR